MNILTKLGLCVFTVGSLAACASVDVDSESSAVKRLVDKDGKLAQNVDADFLGEAYNQDGDAVICKKVKVTGSRIQQYTVCKSETDWEIDADQGADKMKRIQDSSVAYSDKG